MRPEGCLSHEIDPFLQYLQFYVKDSLEKPYVLKREKERLKLNSQIDFALELSQGGPMGCFDAIEFARYEHFFSQENLAYELLFKEEIEKNRKFYKIIVSAEVAVRDNEVLPYHTGGFGERLVWPLDWRPGVFGRNFKYTECLGALRWFRGLQEEVHETMNPERPWFLTDRQE